MGTIMLMYFTCFNVCIFIKPFGEKKNDFKLDKRNIKSDFTENYHVFLTYSTYLLQDCSARKQPFPIDIQAGSVKYQ